MIEVQEESNKINNEIEYPCLMQSDHGNVVLFTSKTIGTVISGEKNQIGTYSKHWLPYVFKLYTGTITLTNKS